MTYRNLGKFGMQQTGSTATAKVSDRCCRMHFPMSESREQFHSSNLTYPIPSFSCVPLSM